MPIPVDLAPADRAPIAQDIPAGTAPAQLVIETEEGACAFAALDAQGRAKQHDRAMLDWLTTSGGTVTVRREALSPCDGLPSIDILVAPPSGWAVGLRHTPERVMVAPVGADSAVTLMQVGDDGRWWFVSGQGTASFAAIHGEQPPTRLAIRFDAARAPAGARQSVALGGAALLDLAQGREGEPSDVVVALAPPGVVETRIEGHWLVLIGQGAGAVDGLLRLDGGPPEALHVEVGPPLPPSERDVLVTVGKTRRLKLDVLPDSVWVVDSDRATVEMQRGRVLLTGEAPGRTHLVIRTGSDLFLVPVAIGH